MPAYSINFNTIIIPNVISYNLYFNAHRHQTSYSCASVIRVTMVSMHNMLQDSIHITAYDYRYRQFTSNNLSQMIISARCK